jgi:hypothetical protein
MKDNKKQPRIVVVEEDSAECPHGSEEAQSCAECLTEVIEVLGTQLDVANEFTDELVDEINKLDAIYFAAVMVREELKKSLSDPGRKLGAAVMIKLLDPVFKAIDEYEDFRKIPEKPGNDTLN